MTDNNERAQIIMQAIEDARKKINDDVAALLGVQAQLVGILIGMLIDGGQISRAELNERIEAVSQGRPEYQQQLLAIVQQALSAQH